MNDVIFTEITPNFIGKFFTAPLVSAWPNANIKVRNGRPAVKTGRAGMHRLDIT